MHKLILVLTIGLFACNPIANRQKNNSEKPVMSDSMSLPDEQTIQTGCARGVAEPIIKKTIYPKTTFVLQPDSITGIETVILDNGDKLIIKNWGCEYYVLTFRFETSRFLKDTTDLNFWFKSAGDLMRDILVGLQSPLISRKR